ncbi:MAG: protein kinase, partial [Polyangiales bacterium]
LADGPLGEAMCAHVGAQVCEALRYAHERFGLVHRDVTPRNVIIDAGGHVRLLDFGIAAPLAHSTPGELFGSPGHMSPEQARGDALGPQSDLFSLGTVLYEALTGTRALSRDASGTQTAERPKSLAAEGAADAELAALIDQLLEPEPAARPKSAAEAAARLRTWLAQRHPEGVAAELGRRAERTRNHPARSSVRPAARGEPEPAHGATPRLTRSIATSPKLSEILSEGTEPLARAARPHATARTKTRWLPRAVLGGALLLLAAAMLLQRQPGVGRRAISTRAPRSPQQLAPPIATPRPSNADAPATTTTDAGKSQAIAPDASRATSAQGRAELSVNALPWAELRLDGRPLGATPQRALGVPPGRHVLLLECPPLGRKARVPIKLDPGAHRRVLVDLNTDPPRVTVN